MALYTKEKLQDFARRYKISAGADMHFDAHHIKTIGADFIKGINMGAKRKPLLPYWFSVEPKVLVNDGN